MKLSAGCCGELHILTYIKSMLRFKPLSFLTSGDILEREVSYNGD